jgi:hypothetical protein
MGTVTFEQSIELNKLGEVLYNLPFKHFSLLTF